MIAHLSMSRILQKKYAGDEFFLRQSNFCYKIQHTCTKAQAFMTIFYHFKYIMFVFASEFQFCLSGRWVSGVLARVKGKRFAFDCTDRYSHASLLL